MQEEDEIYKISNIIPINNIANNSVLSVLDNIQNRTFDNTSWLTTSAAMKKISLLQGLPVTIYSYAAGIFRSNNKFNLFGLIDFFTYISRLNILSTLNVRPDTTYTFLNDQNIIDSYIATHDCGLFGSAINIFMNPIDFITMDNIIDGTSTNLVNNKLNDDSYDISYDLISKITVNSLNSPKYYKIDNSMIILDENKIRKYKSIIYGGIDYEQIALIIENINSYVNVDYGGPDSFMRNKGIFHYYIESQFTILENISSFIGDDLSAASHSPNNTWINSANETIKYNDIINYWLKFYNYEYNYGQIMFFKSHKNIKRIILPKIVNSQFSDQFLETTSVNNILWNIIYDYQYDDDKKDLNPKYDIILMPVNINSSSLSDGKIGNLSNQLTIESKIRLNGGLNNFTYMQNVLAPNGGSDSYDISHNYNFNYSVFYTILCGFDDNLSYMYLDNIKTYSKQPTREMASKKNIMNKIYLCYYDGTNETFKKVLTNSNNSSTLDYFDGIKKIITYTPNNSFIDYEVENIIDTITSFVYNINEGKAANINIAKNNPLSYNNGLILGIDCVILIYLTQLYYNDFTRIFKSGEIFDVYYNILVNNDLFINSNINKFIDILDNRYKYYNQNLILDTSSNVYYTSLFDISLNKKDEFFIYISEIMNRQINTLNQKSSYKFLEFNSSKYIDESGNLLGVNVNNNIKNDFQQIEDKWFDITYKMTNIYSSNDLIPFSDMSNSIYYKLIENKNILLSSTNIDLSLYEPNTNPNFHQNIVSMINNTYDLFLNSLNSTDLIRNFFSNYNNNFNNIIYNNINDIIADYEFFKLLYNTITDTAYKNNLFFLFMKLKLLFLLDTSNYYQINDIIDASYNNNANFTNFVTVKLDPLKWYEYSNYYTIFTKGLLNFTIVDIFNAKNYTLTDFSQNKFNHNDVKNIIDLLKFIFVDSNTLYPNNYDKHDIQTFMRFLLNSKTVIDNWINTNKSNIIYSNTILFITNIFVIIDGLNKFSFNEGTYQNIFMQLDENVRLDIFKEFKTMYA